MRMLGHRRYCHQLKPILYYGQPKAFPFLQEGEHVVFGYKNGPNAELLIECNSLEDMQRLYRATPLRKLGSIRWYRYTPPKQFLRTPVFTAVVF